MGEGSVESRCRDFNGKPAMTFRFVLLTLTLASTLVQAQVCDPRSSQSQITRENLLRASKDGDFPTAQDYADRSRRNLDQLAAGSGRCGCPAAQTRFEAAAGIARLALDADKRQDLRTSITQAITAFEDGMGKLKECSRR